MRCFSQKPIICVHAVIRPGRSCMSILNRYSQERHFFQDSFSKDRMANRWVEAKICSFEKAHFVIFSRRQRLIYPQNCNGFTSFDASLFGSYVTLVRSLVMFFIWRQWITIAKLKYCTGKTLKRDVSDVKYMILPPEVNTKKPQNNENAIR